jgi:hypothetical protein
MSFSTWRELSSCLPQAVKVSAFPRIRPTCISPRPTDSTPTQRHHAITHSPVLRPYPFQAVLSVSFASPSRRLACLVSSCLVMLSCPHHPRIPSSVCHPSSVPRTCGNHSRSRKLTHPHAHPHARSLLPSPPLCIAPLCSFVRITRCFLSSQRSSAPPSTL